MPDNEPGSQWSNTFAAASVDAMRAYDTFVARLFIPFAHDLIERLDPAPGSTVLDVAAGPGTVTFPLAERLGSDGRVIATDLSVAMLAVGREKPVGADWAPIDWVEAPAEATPLPAASVDAVTCQQGLQFFPDKTAALADMRRVLRPGGRAAVAVWTSVENQVFHHLRDAISTVVSVETAGRYLGPFLLSGEVAAEHAREAGFANVELTRVTLPAVLPGGPADLIGTLPAAGIAAEIAALDETTRAELAAEVARRTADATDADGLKGSLTTSFLLLS